MAEVEKRGAWVTYTNNDHVIVSRIFPVVYTNDSDEAELEARRAACDYEKVAFLAEGMDVNDAIRADQQRQRDLWQQQYGSPRPPE